MIENECKSCNSNQGWDGVKCVCKSGLFEINGVCRTCDLNTNYDGKDCICNLGFYGNRDLCYKCHESCGKCSGPAESQCLSCSDVSYNFVNGYCVKTEKCPMGLYLDGASCKPCSSYCSKCKSEEKCDTCITGFHL